MINFCINFKSYRNLSYGRTDIILVYPNPLHCLTFTKTLGVLSTERTPGRFDRDFRWQVIAGMGKPTVERNLMGTGLKLQEILYTVISLFNSRDSNRNLVTSMCN